MKSTAPPRPSVTETDDLMTEVDSYYDAIPLSGSRLSHDITVIPGADFAQDGDDFFYSKIVDMEPSMRHERPAFEQDAGAESDVSLSNFMQFMLTSDDDSGSDDDDEGDDMDQDVHTVDIYEHPEGSSILEQGRIRRKRRAAGHRHRHRLNDDAAPAATAAVENVEYDQFFQMVSPTLYTRYPNLTLEGAHDIAGKLYPDFLKQQVLQ